jgi:hypothetical protein
MAYASVKQASNQNLTLSFGALPATMQIGPITNIAGANIDFSGWDSFEFLTTDNPTDLADSPYGGVTLNGASLVGLAGGLIQLKFAVGAVASGRAPGVTSTFALNGKPTSGDSFQGLATGRVQITR